MNDPMSKPVTVTLSLREWEWLEKLTLEADEGEVIEVECDECDEVMEVECPGTLPADVAVIPAHVSASISRQLEGNRR